VAGDDVMTIVGQLLGRALDLCGVHVAEHDDTARADPAGNRNAHTAYTDDRENFSCCHA
jgi:hypothetical protein